MKAVLKRSHVSFRVFARNTLVMNNNPNHMHNCNFLAQNDLACQKMAQELSDRIFH